MREPSHFNTGKHTHELVVGGNRGKIKASNVFFLQQTESVLYAEEEEETGRHDSLRLIALCTEMGASVTVSLRKALDKAEQS